LHGRYQQYIGVDQSAELIAAARTFTADRPQVAFVVANAKATTLPAQTADLLLSVGALHHMTEMEAVIGEMVRIGKPGAHFAFIEPQNGNPLIQGMRWLRARLDGSYSEEQIYFAAADLVALLTRCGITDLHTDYYGYASTPFAQVVLNPQALTVPLSRWAVRTDQWLERHLPAAMQRLSFDVAITGRLPL
jgi:ubiquinone/menaquinone biosynthesis C-methylase UbiE